MNFIGFISGSFSSVFGGLTNFVKGFFDKASKFDENETIKIMETMATIQKKNKLDSAYYRRGDTLIKFKKTAVLEKEEE